jgi:ppGpp synthetase/RelA/SpoT-type nucleotidyltranferase
MTKSQINKLGEKLRKAFELDTETLLRLQQVRASYDEPMLGAQTLLRELGFEATSRLKTTNTIIEKLRRERTRLAEMQDIGGLRIVSEVNLTKQDEIVKRIADVFPIARVIDRRSRPTHGYRAVHVIATLDERLIEIQVRTQLQDLWAQAMERLADEAGREIRYGGAPQKRGEDVESLLNISHEIAEIEVVLTKLNQLETGLPQPRREPFMQRKWRWHIAEIQSVRANLRGREREIRAMLEALSMRGGAPK